MPVKTSRVLQAHTVSDMTPCSIQTMRDHHASESHRQPDDQGMTKRSHSWQGKQSPPSPLPRCAVELARSCASSVPPAACHRGWLHDPKSGFPGATKRQTERLASTIRPRAHRRLALPIAPPPFSFLVPLLLRHLRSTGKPPTFLSQLCLRAVVYARRERGSSRGNKGSTKNQGLTLHQRWSIR